MIGDNARGSGAGGAVQVGDGGAVTVGACGRPGLSQVSTRSRDSERASEAETREESLGEREIER